MFASKLVVSKIITHMSESGVCVQCGNARDRSLAIYGVHWLRLGRRAVPLNGEETVHMQAHGRGQGAGPQMPRHASCNCKLALLCLNALICIYSPAYSIYDA